MNGSWLAETERGGECNSLWQSGSDPAQTAAAVLAIWTEIDDALTRLALEVVDDAAVLTVSDNGIGITAPALPVIFDPFAPDTQALGFNGVGRGIGLAVVRALVEAHGGTVHAFSEGRGLVSRFVVTLLLPGMSPRS
jgi:signal transduction histidine kinase